VDQESETTVKMILLELPNDCERFANHYFSFKGAIENILKLVQVFRPSWLTLVGDEVA